MHQETQGTFLARVWHTVGAPSLEVPVTPGWLLLLTVGPTKGQPWQVPPGSLEIPPVSNALDPLSPAFLVAHVLCTPPFPL